MVAPTWLRVRSVAARPSTRVAQGTVAEAAMVAWLNLISSKIPEISSTTARQTKIRVLVLTQRRRVLPLVQQSLDHLVGAVVQLRTPGCVWVREVEGNREVERGK